MAVGAQNCGACGVGKAQSLAGRSYCDECTAGRFAGVPGAVIVRALFRRSTDSLLAGMLECAFCAPGTAVAVNRSQSCPNCVAGRYSSGQGGTVW